VNRPCILFLLCATPVLWTASVLDASGRAKRGVEQGMRGIQNYGPRMRGMRILVDWTGQQEAGDPDNFTSGPFGGRGHRASSTHRRKNTGIRRWVWRDLNFVQGLSGFRRCPRPLFPQGSSCTGPSLWTPRTETRYTRQTDGEVLKLMTATGKPGGGHKWLGNLDPVFKVRGGRDKGRCVPFSRGRRRAVSGIVASCGTGRQGPHLCPPRQGTFGYAKT